MSAFIAQLNKGGLVKPLAMGMVEYGMGSPSSY